MRFKLLSILLIIMILPMVMAESHQYNLSADLITQCTNSTGGLCSDTAICNITILYPNQTCLIKGQLMQNQGDYFNYTLQGDQTTTFGEYTSYVCCQDDKYKCVESTYYIVGLGEELTIQNSIMYIIILIILILFMVLTIIGIAKTKFVNEYDEDENKLIVNWGKYFKMLFIVIFYGLLLLTLNFTYGITSTIITLQFISEFFYRFYLIMIWLIFPFFLIIGWATIANIILDAKLNKLIERGLDER